MGSSGLVEFANESKTILGTLFGIAILWGYIGTSEFFTNFTMIQTLVTEVGTLVTTLMGGLVTVVGVVIIAYVVKKLMSLFDKKSGNNIAA